MKMNFRTIFTGLLLLSGSQLYAQSDTAFSYRKPLFDYDYGKPVFALEKESNTDLSLRYAALTGYREGVRSNTHQMVNFDPRLYTNHFYWNNISARDLLMIGTRISPSRFLFEVKDPSGYAYRMEYGNKETWLRKHGYCLEYMLPAGARMTIEQQQKLVEEMLGVEGTWELRKVKCLAMVRTSKRNRLKPDGKSVPGIIRYLELMYGQDGAYGSPLPIVNETGFGDGQGLEGSFVWTDLEKVRKQLKEYDLDLLEKELETSMYVIKEINE